MFSDLFQSCPSPVSQRTYADSLVKQELAHPCLLNYLCKTRRPGQEFLIRCSVPDNFLTTLSRASEVRLNLCVKVSGWTIARHAILGFSA